MTRSSIRRALVCCGASGALFAATSAASAEPFVAASLAGDALFPPDDESVFGGPGARIEAGLRAPLPVFSLSGELFALPSVYLGDATAFAFRGGLGTHIGIDLGTLAFGVVLRGGYGLVTAQELRHHGTLECGWFADVQAAGDHDSALTIGGDAGFLALFGADRSALGATMSLRVTYWFGTHDGIGGMFN